MRAGIPQLSGKELAAFVIKNKDLLISQKKAAIKYADAVSFSGTIIGKSGDVIKEGIGVQKSDGSIKNSTVINTAYWFDSHGDVHVPGLWNKSLADNAKRPVNMIMLLQEHKMMFDHVIADKSNVNPYVATMTWQQLGVNAKGETQALIFDNIISPTRNPFMYQQYKEGNVSNHSVGMQYVSIDLAINSGEKDLKQYKETWDKYIDLIANKDEAEDEGIFWAVMEAKVIEGSAVLRGSNAITPTLEQSLKDTHNEPITITHNEPTDKGTNIFKTINKIYSK